LSGKVSPGVRGEKRLNTTVLYLALNVTDQVSHPYKATNKIIVLYILILKFSDRRGEDKEF
jgi:hypothetical protein